MLEIRHAKPCESPLIVEFQINMAIEAEQLALNHEVVKAGVEAVFEDSSKGTYWVALLDGSIVGCLLVVPEWSDWRSATILWIHSVFVVPSARRKGIFSTLFKHLKHTVVNSTEFAGLRLYVDKSNITAQQTYESLSMSRDHYYLYEWLKE